MPERDPNSEAVKIWREKLAYLQKQEAITADPEQKFALSHRIGEAQAKIAELTQAHPAPSAGVRHSNVDAGPVEPRKPPSADGAASSNLKQFSEQDVQRVAIQQMRERGTTTTLEIKLKLRSDGFFATQRQVSEAMTRLAAAQGWMSTISHDHMLYSLPPEQGPEAEARQLGEMEGNKKRLVILVHGIRTRAEWQGRLRFLFEATGETVVEPLGYGYFDVFRFLFPFWTRRAPVKEVLRKIRDAISQHRDEHREIIFVAHSFGTFILANILRENPDIRADRMLLCGSVIKRTYLWDSLPNRPKVVINESGSRDIWPILAKSITWGYGSTGTFGFQTPGVRDRYHNLAHSDYFKGDFAERFWVPWIRLGQVIPTPFETGHAPPTPLWKNLFEVFPLKWVGLLVLALTLVSYLTHPAWHHPWLFQ